jgi:hypothetical protein
MKTKVVLTCALLGGLLPPPVHSFASTLFLQAGGTVPASTNSTEENLYADLTRAINESRWSDAEALSARVIQQHGARTEGALYWRAYAENKEGRSSDALNTCVELRNSHPKSRWLEECSALEIEIRGQSGHPVPPQSEPTEDLKLLALNSLMQQDEARAMPIIQQILNGESPEKLKERVLFVLSQSNSKQAQDLLKQITRGQTFPELQVKAIQMFSAMQGKQSADTFTDIYRKTSDERVKKAVLRAYMVSGNEDKLLDAAQHEPDPKLAQYAISQLGTIGAVSDLLTLYKATDQEKIKSSILDAFIMTGKNGADALGNIASSEQTPELRYKAIRNLGIAGGTEVSPTLVALYKNNSDLETKKALVQALFVSGDTHDLVTLARSEKDPAMRKVIVQNLSLMQNKEATDYMLEILEK